MCAEINTVQSAKTARNYPQLCAFGETTVHWRSDLLAWLIGSFLTTSAISSIPFLDVTNSLLGRMDFRTAWGGRFELGASMSPIVMKRKTLLELRAAQTTSTAAILVQNKHTHTHSNEIWGGVRLLWGGSGNNDKLGNAARAPEKKKCNICFLQMWNAMPPAAHNGGNIQLMMSQRKKSLLIFFFSFPLQFRNLKQPHHA